MSLRKASKLMSIAANQLVGIKWIPIAQGEHRKMRIDYIEASERRGEHPKKLL